LLKRSRRARERRRADSLISPSHCSLQPASSQQYAFEYEEDDGEEGEVDVENSYYSAKCESQQSSGD
jgi:hypothetical protein